MFELVGDEKHDQSQDEVVNISYRGCKSRVMQTLRSSSSHCFIAGGHSNTPHDVTQGTWYLTLYDAVLP